MNHYSLVNRNDIIQPGLGLLVKLRWLAFVGQVGLCVFATLIWQLHLLWHVLVPCMLVTALTNLIVVLWRGRHGLSENTQCTFLLFLDTITLTVMLYSSGGSHNPFATFYLLHIAIATFLLSYRTAWAIVILSAVCYSLLFVLPHAAHPTDQNTTEIVHDHSQHSHSSQHEQNEDLSHSSHMAMYGDYGSLDFHLQGMLVAMILVGVGIVFFIGKLRITLQRREEELEHARLRGLRNERFASLATLAAGVAHELATPLGTIAIASEDMEYQAKTSSSAQEWIKDAQLIRSEVRRCTEVLSKLHQQTTDGVGDPFQELVIADIGDLLKTYVKPDLVQRIEIKTLGKGESLYVPQTALLQALAVLIQNAFQASSHEDRVRLSIQSETDFVRFTVEDEGEGMSEEVLSRLGEPFFTTKEPGRGMGLGLFLVRMFVERIQGELDIDSSLGRGTTVRLTIPLKNNEQENIDRR